jgi:hypothetical protein
MNPQPTTAAMLAKLPASVRTNLETAFRAQVESVYNQYNQQVDRLIGFTAGTTQAPPPIAPTGDATNQAAALPAAVSTTAAPSVSAKAAARATAAAKAAAKATASAAAKAAAAAATTAAAKAMAKWVHPVLPKVTPTKEKSSSKSTKRKSSDSATHNNTDPAASTGKSAHDTIDLLSDSDDSSIMPASSLVKNIWGFSSIDVDDICSRLSEMGSILQVVQIMPNPDSSNEHYRNGMNFLATVLAITGARTEVLERLHSMRSLSLRKNVRSTDVIGFLTEHGVNIVPINDPSYEAIMTGDHKNPVILEYSVMRHPLERAVPPTSWIQFCLLYKECNMLIPFNEIGSAISFGRQFDSSNWKSSFEQYCKINLNFRIAPVARTTPGPANVVRGLDFNAAWTITMPPAQPS